jgi:hypothetical protein
MAHVFIVSHDVMGNIFVTVHAVHASDLVTNVKFFQIRASTPLVRRWIIKHIILTLIIIFIK